MDTTYDTIIIGAGAAGLSAGIYAGRYGMKTLILSQELGGETLQAGLIENWPGDKEVEGYKLVSRFRDHAIASGAEIVTGSVVSAEHDGDVFRVMTKKGDNFIGKTLILAQGSRRRRLGLPNEDVLTGKGVHYCMTCDGPVYGGKEIAVVGGGDASIKGVLLAAQYASRIFVIVRGKELRAEPTNVEQMMALGDKVTVLYETEVKEIIGTDKLEKVVLSRPYNDSTELSVEGLFIEIGAEPDTDIAKTLGVELDEYGYVKTDCMMKTNIPSVLAAGDIVNHFGHFKQVITASATGTAAATAAFEYIKNKK
ncbi:MAG: FAD-dependent oxidoreductase [Candidatus Yonathbacteria bacterium]|nr:FAD-dependent oxidoreductase [Candidatus Yonathbacteria bacterium]